MYDFALAVSVLCFVLVGFAFVRSPVFSIFHPLTVYLAFHGLIFVIRPIFARIIGYSYIYRAYQFTPSDSDKLTVIVASNIGFLAFAFFAWRSGGVPMEFKLDRFITAERERLKPLFLVVLAICVPLGSYSLLRLLTDASTIGGISGMAMDKGTGAFVSTTGNGYLLEAQLMLASCGAIIAWLYRFRLIAILPLLAFIVGRAGTGGRGPFVTALVSVGLLYLYEQRRRFPGLKVGLGIAVIVALFLTIGADRGLAIRSLFNEDQAQSHVRSTNTRFMEGMDLGNMEYFEFLVYAVPQRSGTYSYFTDNLQLFTEPVPRALWPGKPVGPPFNRIFLFDHGYPIGMTRSLPGQGWYSMGWLGVIIWCGLWGYALGLLYRKYVQSAQGTLQTIAYMVFLPVLIIAYRDGVLLTIFRQMVFFIAPIVIWYGLSRFYAVPRAADFRRAAMAEWSRRFGDAGNGKDDRAAGVEARPAPDRTLPAAVARRRAALRARD